jgi:hypothetical protein
MRRLFPLVSGHVRQSSQVGRLPRDLFTPKRSLVQVQYRPPAIAGGDLRKRRSSMCPSLPFVVPVSPIQRGKNGAGTAGPLARFDRDVRLRSVVAVVLLTIFVACGGSSPEEPSRRSFDEALEAGASCQELFDIRNEADPKSSEIEEMNVRLREVGCFNSSSERMDA